MNIRPLHNRIVVKPIKTSDNRVSAKEKSHEGEVVAVSRGKRLKDGSVIPLDVGVGNDILTVNIPAVRSSSLARSI